MADKKFFWIKLKQDFFDLEAIDWLMDQENGSDYVVLYQKLCLLTANTCGELVRQVGEMMVPYDCKKIAQQTKFPFDTVVIAMELFRKLGLIFEQTNGILRISEVNKMIGSESEWAEKKRQQRTKIGQNKDNVPIESGHQEDIVLEGRGQAEDIVQDKKGTMSDKSIEIRTKSTELRDLYTHTTRAREGVQFYGDLFAIVSRVCPELAKRQQAEIDAGRTQSVGAIEAVLSEVDLTEEDCEKLFAHVSKTYIVRPKYKACNIEWVLNHIAQVWDIPEDGGEKSSGKEDVVDRIARL